MGKATWWLRCDGDIGIDLAWRRQHVSSSLSHHQRYGSGEPRQQSGAALTTPASISRCDAESVERGMRRRDDRCSRAAKT